MRTFSQPASSCLLFSPLSGEFSPGPSLSQAREAHLCWDLGGGGGETLLLGGLYYRQTTELLSPHPHTGLLSSSPGFSLQHSTM